VDIKNGIGIEKHINERNKMLNNNQLNKQPHKFFEVFLDNDLEDFYTFLLNEEQKMLNGEIEGISESDGKKYYEKGMTTMFSNFYNLFKYDYKQIINLNNALLELTQTACDYYNINFNEQNYLIKGWFNCDSNDFKNISVPKELFNKDMTFHDDEERGIPDFHGYYCINAEPSVTIYKLESGELFQNVNKNNRAILSETGLLHGRGYWKENSKRITLGYSVQPANSFDDKTQKLYTPLVYKK
jgi:hypothetical protein